MVVIIIAVITIWLVPAGHYNILAATDDKAFVVFFANGNDISLSFNQITLDRLKIKIELKKFKTAAFRKSVSIPGKEIANAYLFLRKAFFRSGNQNAIVINLHGVVSFKVFIRS